MKEKFSIYKTFIVFFLGFNILLSCISCTCNINKDTNKYTFKKVSISNLDIYDNGNDTRLIRAIDESVNYLSTHKNRTFIFNKKRITSNELKKSLINLRNLIQQKTKEISIKDLAKYFDIYSLSKKESIWDYIIDLILHKNINKNKILITGYFEPEIVASYKKTKEFNCPIYERPSDLIQVYLPLFNKKLPSETIWGRVYKGKLIPYFTRKELEERIKDGDLNVKPIAWLKSPIDLLMLQIQGSAVLDINGTKRFIHYSASNGRSYVSIGNILLKNGLLPYSKLSWQDIKKWAERHPKEFTDILNRNPRYIFFKWEDKGPLGSLGLPLVPMRTIAMDQSIYPPLLITFIVFKNGSKEFHLITLNFDKGAAIKGYRRIDLYCGEGKKAGLLAGSLKSYGKIYFLIPK